ncbi:MAG: DNA-processing protein DprA [Epsilonproteobacteria bacterium]|nr:DNA-processing protein DprA [Campylobacterota bacterium]NPA56638.1 DNA-processing protein DprA [Campylobacterota bacterium]
MVEIGGKRVEYQGNLELLKAPKISIVGSRRANSYAKERSYQLAREAVRRGWVVVSGGAIGIDITAHRGAGAERTIVVLPCGIDLRYPKINAPFIDEVAEKGLVISPFPRGFRARPWSFVVRNRLVVELGELLVVAHAQQKSGSMRSVAFAQEMGKPIFVFPHRIGESQGTNRLAQRGEASVIWDMEEFLDRLGGEMVEEGEGEDPLISYLKGSPFYDEAVERYGLAIMEMEVEGRIEVVDGRIFYRGER